MSSKLRRMPDGSYASAVGVRSVGYGNKGDVLIQYGANNFAYVKTTDIEAVVAALEGSPDVERSPELLEDVWAEGGTP